MADGDGAKVRIWMVPAILLLAVLLLAGGCLARRPEPADPAQDGGDGEPKIQAMATIYPLYEFTLRVAGQRAQVSMLTPAGVDAHEFEPGPRDLERMAATDLFVYNGAGLEPWLDTLLGVLQEPGGPLLVEATEGIDLQPEQRPDPHVWLDPRLAAEQVSLITEALAQVDPEGAPYYREREQALVDRLHALAKEYEETLRECRLKDLVVQHGSYAYWRRFGLNPMPLTEGGHHDEPSPRRMAEVAALMREKGIAAVFADPLAGAQGAATLARETGARLLPLHSIENLSFEEHKTGEDYFSLMVDNLANLRQGLDCNPEGGAGDHDR